MFKIIFVNKSISEKQVYEASSDDWSEEDGFQSNLEDLDMHATFRDFLEDITDAEAENSFITTFRGSTWIVETSTVDRDSWEEFKIAAVSHLEGIGVELKEEEE